MMRKRLLIAAVLAMFVTGLCACPTSASPDTVVETTSVEASTVIEKIYEPDVNYMALMIEAAVNGRQSEVYTLNAARNAKICDMGLPDKQLTVETFLTNFAQYAGFSNGLDYKAELVACCIAGDTERGDRLAREYAVKCEVLGIDEDSFTFNDLFLVSKIIYSEAGSLWLSQDWKMKVGEVLLNRVASPEFPNTISECVYQKGQYSGARSNRFKNMLPNEGSAQAALRLMCGERLINDSAVVFQSNRRGSSRLYERMYDSVLGSTYLCYSYHMELYGGN